MSNMSYCRFENTLDDLRDCYDNWEEETNEREERKKKKMMELCRQIVDDYGHLYEEH